MLVEGKNKLSYSQIRTYAECGLKYKYHYVDKLRPKKRNSALIFGTAFDKAIEATLKDDKVNEREVFDQWWQTQKLNSEDIDIPSSLLVVYSQSDFDPELYTDDDIRFIQAKAQELIPEIYEQSLNNWVDSYDTCLQAKKAGSWTEQQNKYYNICSWLSLRRKAYLMFESHRTKVLPRFKKILAIQETIELDNGQGDTLIGYADLRAVWEDDRTVVFDYKTATVPYKPNEASESPQLALYNHALGNKWVGFIVFRKAIKKIRIKICSKCGHDGTGRKFAKCQECDGDWNVTLKLDCEVQVIIDEVQPKVEEDNLNYIEVANQGIKSQQFEANPKSCMTIYGPCPYYNKCHNNSDEDLIQL